MQPFGFVRYRAATGEHCGWKRDGAKWGKMLLRSDAGVPVEAVVEVGTGGKLEFDQ